jgi:hypothetical protein
VIAAELRVLLAVITAASHKYKINEEELKALPKTFW